MSESITFDCLVVTAVNIKLVEPTEDLQHIVAEAEVVLNDQILIKKIRVMDGVNGLFISFYNTRATDGDDFVTVVNPLTRQLRTHIENCVLEKYWYVKEG